MSIVKNAIKEELTTAVAVSKGYANKIATAKTKIKSDTYRKKLKKNNQVVANLLLALDKIENKEYNSPNNET